MMLSLERKNLFPNVEQVPEVFVAMVNESLRKETVHVVQELRASGLRTDYDLKKRNLQKQLEYADALRVRVALIVGPRELKEGKVRLRDMKSGEEKDVRILEAGEEVRKITRKTLP